MPQFQDPEICRGILESMQTGVCVLDLQYNVVFWSDGAERITGFLRHEVLGRPCTGNILLHCNSVSCECCLEECPVAAAKRYAKPAETPGYLHHKSGHQIAVHIWAVPVRDARGSIIGTAESFEVYRSTNFPDRPDEMKASGCVDDITGIANHAIMQSHLRETLGTFAELGVPFGILCARVEGLSHFRASYTPEAGSSLLRAVAQTIEGALAKADFVGRWSDDEFLVILSGCEEATLLLVRDRIRHMLANNAIEWWGEQLSQPVAIGHATCCPADSLDSLLLRAAQSLNLDASKRLGLTKSPAIQEVGH